MQQNRKPAVVLAIGTLLFGLVACGDDRAGDDPGAKHTASNGNVFNDRDVDFASGMIPHHAQALSMVDLTRGRKLSPDVQELVDGIQSAQASEIEQMVDWLTAWDRPIPETMRDHVNDGHHTGDTDGVATDTPGMMTAEEMTQLEAARGPEFEDMWLELMIEHHKGAIEMAKDQQQNGAFGPALKLARQISAAQQAEIDRMTELMAS